MSTVLLVLVTLMPGQIPCHALAGGAGQCRKSNREKVKNLVCNWDGRGLFNSGRGVKKWASTAVTSDPQPAVKPPHVIWVIWQQHPNLAPTSDYCLTSGMSHRWVAIFSL